jgi:hypothetical protein
MLVLPEMGQCHDRLSGEHTINCKELFMDAKEDNAMTQYNKITALYSRLSVGDEDRDGGESNSIVNQKAFLERYARQEKLPNIRHYIDDDESGRFFDRSAYVRMMDDVESGKIGIVVMKDMTRWFLSSILFFVCSCHVGYLPRSL